MPVLSRKTDERIRIGDDITIVVSQIKGNRVTLAIEAPDGVRILRGELEKIANEFKQENAPLPRAVPPPLFVAPVTLGNGTDSTECFFPRQAR